MEEKIGKTIAVGYIAEYLKSQKDPNDPATIELNAAVLSNMSKRFASVTFRQFMLEKQAGFGKGRYFPSNATKCERRNWREWMGIPGEPMDCETLVKFWYGDLLEIGTYGLLDLAYIGTKHSIGFSGEKIDVPFGSRFKGVHTGKPDGLVYFDYSYHKEKYGVDLKPPWLEGDGEFLVLECKSMGDYPFRVFTESGPDDTWGYLGQIHKMMEGLKTARFLYIAVNREKGGIAEYVGSFQKKYQAKADAIYDTVMEYAEKGTPPPIPIHRDGFGLGKVGPDRWAELELNCAFCSHNKGCYKDAGYTDFRTREVKTRFGVKKVHDVRAPGATVQMDMDGMVQEIVGGTRIGGQG